MTGSVRLYDTTLRDGAQREGLRAEATVKVSDDGEVLHAAADGNVPVNALDAALRTALAMLYPALAAVQLIDYKVRILDGAAAAEALVDSLEDAIWKTGAEVRRRDERQLAPADEPQGPAPALTLAREEMATP